MEWFGNLLSILVGRVLFESIVEWIFEFMVFITNLLPHDVRSIFSTSFTGIFGAFFTPSNSLPTGDLASAMGFAYTLVLWATPFKAMMGQIIFYLGLIALIRFIRWMIGVIPGVDG